MGARPSHGPIPLESLVGTGIPVLVLLGSLLLGRVHDGAAPDASLSLPFPTGDLTEGVSVVMTVDGYVVALSDADGVWSVPVPCHRPGCPESSDWDVPGLQRSLAAVKMQVPDMQHMTVVPGARTPYEMVLETVFAARAAESGQPLFPLGVVSRPYDEGPAR